MRYTFDAAERFVVGTLGEPGRRTFVVQFRQGADLMSLVLEKQQVQLLAERVETILDGAETLGEFEVPAPPDDPRDSGPLDAPVEFAWRVGEIRLGWDMRSRAVVIEFSAVDDDEIAAVHITMRQAQDFIVRARRTVASGRPVCPFCAQPLEASGHICPRSNGYRAPLLQ